MMEGPAPDDPCMVVRAYSGLTRPTFRQRFRLLVSAHTFTTNPDSSKSDRINHESRRLGGPLHCVDRQKNYRSFITITE